jgi:hypothetical protein
MNDKNNQFMQINKPHSRAGVISSVIGVLNFLMVPLYYFALTFDSQAHLFVGNCLSPIVWLTGITLAIVGLTNKNHRKLFPIIGLILNITGTVPVYVSVASALYYGFFWN